MGGDAELSVSALELQLQEHESKLPPVEALCLLPGFPPHARLVFRDTAAGFGLMQDLQRMRYMKSSRGSHGLFLRPWRPHRWGVWGGDGVGAFAALEEDERGTRGGMNRYLNGRFAGESVLGMGFGCPDRLLKQRLRE